MLVWVQQRRRRALQDERPATPRDGGGRWTTSIYGCGEDGGSGDGVKYSFLFIRTIMDEQCTEISSRGDPEALLVQPTSRVARRAVRWRYRLGGFRLGEEWGLLNLVDR